MNATARNAQRDVDRHATMAGTVSHGRAHGRNGGARPDIPDDEHLRAAHGPILTADDLAVLRKDGEHSREQQAKAALDTAASVTREEVTTMTTHNSQPPIQIVAVEYPASVLTHLRKEHGRSAPARGSDGTIHDAVQQHLTAHLHGQFRGNGHYHVRNTTA